MSALLAHAQSQPMFWSAVFNDYVLDASSCCHLVEQRVTIEQIQPIITAGSQQTMFMTITSGLYF